MKRQTIRKIRRSFFVLVMVTVASFLSMLVVQLFMGGIRGVDAVAMKSIMLGLGMALVVFLAPAKKLERYPWQ